MKTKSLIFLLTIISTFQILCAQEVVYIQPTNKSEICKICSDSPVVWTGSCKNGFAQGYGKLSWAKSKSLNSGSILLFVNKGLAHGFSKHFDEKGEFTALTFYYEQVEYSEKSQTLENGNYISGEIYDNYINGFALYAFLNENKKSWQTRYVGHHKDGYRDGFGEIYYYRERIKQTAIFEKGARQFLGKGNQKRVENFMATYKTKAPAKKLYETIIPFVDKKDLDDLEKDLSNALKSNPKDAMATLGLGGIHYKRKDYLKAIEYYNKAIDLNKKDGWAYYFRACANHKLEEYKLSIQDIEKVIFQYDLGNIHAYFYYGMLNYKLGDIDKAFGYLDWITRVRPKFGHAHYYLALTNLARSTRHTDILDGSIFSFLNTEIRTKYPIKEHMDSAIRYLEEAGGQELLYDVYVEQGEQYMEQRNYNKAAEQFKLAATFEDDNLGLLGYLMICYTELNRYNEAIILGSKINKIYPETGIGHYLLGNIYVKVKKYDTAIINYELAIEKDAQLIYWNNLAYAQYQIDSSTDICKSLKKAFDGGVDINYGYLVNYCGMSQQTRFCFRCMESGHIQSGYKQNLEGNLEPVYEACSACNGTGKISEKPKDSKLNFYIH